MWREMRETGLGNCWQNLGPGFCLEKQLGWEGPNLPQALLPRQPGQLGRRQSRVLLSPSGLRLTQGAGRHGRSNSWREARTASPLSSCTSVHCAGGRSEDRLGPTLQSPPPTLPHSTLASLSGTPGPQQLSRHQPWFAQEDKCARASEGWDQAPAGLLALCPALVGWIPEQVRDSPSLHGGALSPLPSRVL